MQRKRNHNEKKRQDCNLLFTEKFYIFLIAPILQYKAKVAAGLLSATNGKSTDAVEV
jgi:hypothetical protein